MKCSIILISITSILNIVYSSQLNQSVNYEITQQNHKAKFMDLTSDEQLIILEHLNVEDLISIATVNTQLSYLAAKAFKLKHSKKLFRFISNTKSGTRINPNYSELSGHVDIGSFKLMMDIFKHFGHLIERFQLNNFRYWNQKDEIMKVSEALTLYCSNTLIELYFEEPHPNTFDKMIKPFKKVEKVKFTHIYTPIKTAALPLHKLFPMMKSMTFNVVRGLKMDFFEGTYPNMDRLNVELSSIFDQDSDLVPLLVKNPQIRHIKLEYCSHKELMVINQHLPELETLEIVLYKLSFKPHELRPKIIFKNVRTFSNELVGEIAPTDVEFPSLTELKLKSMVEDLSTKWLNFITQNINLTKLILQPVDEGVVSTLAQSQLGLVDVHLELEKSVRFETMVNFVENNNSLNVIRFTISEYILQSTYKKLKETFENEWTISNYRFDILLERKPKI